MSQDNSRLKDFADVLKDCIGGVLNQESETEVKKAKFWELIKEMEEGGQMSKNELGEIRATLILNYGPQGKLRPGLITSIHKNTLAIMCEVLTRLEKHILDLEQKS